MRFFRFLTLAALISPLPISASVAIAINADRLETSSGAAMPTTGLVALVVSTNGSFSPIAAGSTIAAGDFLNAGQTNEVLKTWSLGAASGTAGAFYDSTGALTLPANLQNSGDSVGLYWFPTLTTASDVASSGTTYGDYLGPGSTGSSAWVLPAESAQSTLDMYTTNGVFNTGTLSASTGLANLTVGAVPEPGKSFLLCVGLLGMLLRRRRA